jgi:hypothetical protein
MQWAQGTQLRNSKPLLTLQQRVGPFTT